MQHACRVTCHQSPGNLSCNASCSGLCGRSAQKLGLQAAQNAWTPFTHSLKMPLRQFVLLHAHGTPEGQWYQETAGVMCCKTRHDAGSEG